MSTRVEKISRRNSRQICPSIDSRERNRYQNSIFNQINYIKTLTLIPKTLSPELYSYLPLFSYVLTKLGARSWNHMELAEKIELCTGGFNCAVLVIPNLEDQNQYEMYLEFGSYCLE